MKQVVTAVGLLFAFASASAQSPAHQAALAYLDANAARLGLSAADYADLVALSEHTSAQTGLTHLYLQQRSSGLPVAEAISSVAVTSGGDVAAFNARIVPGLAGKVNGATPAITASSAVALAAANRGIAGLVGAASTLPGAEQVTTFALGTLAASPLLPVKARLAYHKASAASYRLAWQVELYTADEQHYWTVFVDANASTVLRVEDQVVSDRFGPDGPRVASDAHLSAWTRQATRVTRFDLYANPQAGPVAHYAARAVASAYRVLDRPLESPEHGARTLVSTSGDATASAYGWHSDGGVPYSITRGNNVWATVDAFGAEVGYSATGRVPGSVLPALPGQPLEFDFALDLTKQPGAYTDAAITNLFYWNNLMHDVFYHYGFDEPSGNFQNVNNPAVSGGVGLDGVLAQAQDGGGTNNANFLTLADGVPGRMQMYLWTSATPVQLVVNSPVGVAGTYTAQAAGFGPAISEAGTTQDLVMAVPANGCGFIPPVTLPAGFIPKPFDNAAAVAGKIAVVDRGDCAFVEKIYNAQISGAIGVVVVNNVAGDPITMGSSSPLPVGPDPVSAAIVIPSLMVSQADGATIKAALPTLPVQPAVNATMRSAGTPAPNRDGDFDNGVIAHEYGHGISTRLVGGPTKLLGCLTSAEQGGEGWSDFFGLMMTMKPGDVGTTSHGIGTYVSYEPTTGGGIRPAPYSTLLGANPYTYANLNDAEILEPHGVGFLWATMLNEVAWKYIERYGFDADITNVSATNTGEKGNVRALKVVVTGLKLTPCAPGFVDQRNAILQADRLLYGGANHDLLWEAFAKRGLGFSASQGDPDVRGDETVAFDLPPTPAGRLTLARTASAPTATDGGTLTFTLTATNGTAGPLNVTLRDTLDARTAYLAGSASDGGTLDGHVVTWPAVSLAAGATISRSYSVFVATGAGTTYLFRDDLEGGTANWTTSVGLDTWTASTTNPHSGSTAWFAADPDRLSLQTLTLANPVTLGASSVLSFWHSYATESTFDGGVVELSTDGGLTWTDLGPYMTQHGYDDFVPAANNPLYLDQKTFGGSSGGYVNTLVDLSSFAGQSAQVRFVFKSDYLTGATGWSVDDVEITNAKTSVTARGGVDAGGANRADAAQEVIVLPGAGTYTAFTGRAILAGAYDAATGLMRNALNTGGVLPTTQPFGDAIYNGTPLDYDGSDAVAAGFFAAHPDVVDWVLVEFRTSPNVATQIGRRPAFVLRDGQLVALDGVSPLVLSGTAPTDLYVIVRHRNHLAVMTANDTAPSGALVRHDYTSGQAQAFGTTPMCDLTGGRYGLCGGDADANGQVQNADKNAAWRTTVGLSGYRAADFDLNGQVQNADKNSVWRLSVGRGTQVN